MRAGNALRSILIAVPAAISLAGGDSFAQKVGTTGAVNPASVGTPPGGSSRTLEIGSDVVFRERIETTGSGSLQVLFIDTTTLSVGPNSDLLIDEFVYDPNAGTGTFVATLTKGSLRFVGGRISHTQGATIHTPVATVGVRGGGVYIQAGEEACRNATPVGESRRRRDCPGLIAVCTAGDCTIDPAGAGRAVSLDVGEAVQVAATGAAQTFVPSTQGLQSFTGAITRSANEAAGRAVPDLSRSAAPPPSPPDVSAFSSDPLVDPNRIPESPPVNVVQEPEPPTPERPEPPRPPPPPPPPPE